MTWGVNANGFNRKPLADILADIEQSNIDIFTAALIQSPQSPMGQINALRSDAIAQVWEALESVYQSLDPDQAEGVRLDMIARLRLISRQAGESDESLRMAITNVGKANMRDADFYRSVVNAPGITWAKIYSNDTGYEDDRGMPPHSVAVAAIGGDDADIAMIARQYVVPGITIYGNRDVSTEVDGFCRTMSIIRPVEVPIVLNLEINKWNDMGGCPPPSNAAIAQLIYGAFQGNNRPANGVDITKHLIDVTVSCVYPNVEIINASGARKGAELEPLPIDIGFYEIATLLLDDITVTIA